MTDLLDLSKEQIITSREIAELTGKLHKNVMRDIENSEEYYFKVFGGGLNFEQVSYTLESTFSQKHRMYILTKSQSLFIVSGYSGELRAMIQKRWEELEHTYQAQVLEEAERKFIRERARTGAEPMTSALKTQREDAGKEVKYYHYSTEHDMIDVMVLGMKAKKYCTLNDIKRENLRDHLTKSQIDLIEFLQSRNTVMLEMDMDYHSRKKALKLLFIKKSVKLGMSNDVA
jgi:Rha family phage regulatory protein